MPKTSNPQIDMAVVAKSILGEKEFSLLPMDNSIKFLEQIRLFYQDAKLQSINNISSCKETIIEGWLNETSSFIVGKEKLAKEVISDFYDLIYKQFKDRDTSFWLPIETAPKDGSQILAFDGANYAVVEWVYEEFYWKLSVNDASFSPKHWHPIASIELLPD